MSAVCLKKRTVVENQRWSSVFPSLGTEAKSNLFIKQLTTICISTILYLRKVLPDDYFDTKCFEGMSLKFLKSVLGYDYANKINEWLEGAFEAIDKKYLKHLMLDIKDNDSKITLEIYTITFNYQKGNEAINVSFSRNASGKENFDELSSPGTKLNTIRLLQMCHAVTQTCTDLPTQVTLAIRLSYYEDTPEDYQPRGFKAYEPVDVVFLKDTRSIEVGITGTKFHSFKLVNKSCFNENFLKTTEMPENESPVKKPEEKKISDKNSTTKAKRELKFKCLEVPTKKNCSNLNNTCQNDRNNNFSDTKTRKSLLNRSLNVSECSSKEDVMSQKLRCPCLSNEVSEIMFCCKVCKFLVHSECFGVLQFDLNKKIRFYCHICHQPEGNPKSHDNVMTNLKNPSDQQKLALLRRFLKYCYLTTAPKITLNKMQKIGGPKCSKETIQIVLKKMIESQIVKPMHMRRSFLIDRVQLSKKILLYFYRLRYNNSDTKTDAKRPNPDNIFFVNKCRKSTVTPQIIGTQHSQMSCSQHSLPFYL